MSLQIASSIKISKVDPGRASNAQSSARLYPEFAKCQVRPAIDNYGRPAPYTSIVTTEGFDSCNSASLRVDVENWQRPKYFTYLPSVGMDPSQMDKMRDVHLGKDFLGVKRDQSFNLPPQNRVISNTVKPKYSQDRDFAQWMGAISNSLDIKNRNSNNYFT